MKRHVIVSAVVLSLAASLVLVSGAALAQQPRTGSAGGRPGAGGHVGMHRPVPPPFVRPPFVHRPGHFPARFFVYAAPPWYGPSYSTPVYSPPVVIAVAPPPPITPYQWVWIPSPPPAPPTAPPPPSAPAAADREPARQSQIYRWVDEDGVANWTDGWDSVPERYRAQAKRRVSG
ncbi:MAG TPA: hypothetical protein VGT00_06225 [Methylomirabilota bacterium]|nr:hypothetical protein [Methylomirabilota bacterium]